MWFIPSHVCQQSLVDQEVMNDKTMSPSLVYSYKVDFKVACLAVSLIYFAKQSLVVQEVMNDKIISPSSVYSCKVDFKVAHLAIIFIYFTKKIDFEGQIHRSHIWDLGSERVGVFLHFVY